MKDKYKVSYFLFVTGTVTINDLFLHRGILGELKYVALLLNQICLPVNFLIGNHSNTFVALGGLWILDAIRSLGISHKFTRGYGTYRKYDIELEVDPHAVERQVSCWLFSLCNLYCNNK